MARIDILGVPIDCVSKGEAVELMQRLLTSPGQYHLTAPNPEAVVEAQRNPEFLKALQESALNTPDGVGLVVAARVLGKRELRKRAVATDTFPAFCRIGGEGFRLFLLGGAPGVAERAAEVLKKSNPALVIAGTYAGSPKREEEAEIVERINRSGASVLFVAYGSPQQDLWIARNLSRMPGVKVAAGVGGLLDFLTGKQRRAPVWMRRAGLEWSYRFAREPQRARRMWNAVVVFPYLVLRQRGVR